MISARDCTYLESTVSLPHPPFLPPSPLSSLPPSPGALQYFLEEPADTIQPGPLISLGYTHTRPGNAIGPIKFQDPQKGINRPRSWNSRPELISISAFSHAGEVHWTDTGAGRTARSPSSAISSAIRWPPLHALYSRDSNKEFNEKRLF